MKTLEIKEPFELESGESLPALTIGYSTYGKLNKERSNVVWVCHALTANSEVTTWWKGLVGEGCYINPTDHFIVCANVLGSCYGTTGPRSINPKTNTPYGLDFPMFTVRDTVNVHTLLAKHLDIRCIHLLVGGSYGGSQALEMALHPDFDVKNMRLIATGAMESAWNIGIHEAQRMALEADATFASNTEKSGARGLKAARAIGILTYRTEEAFEATQSDEDDRLDHFSASSYMQYQGKKLEERFHAHCYWYLTKCMDTHNVGRGRGGLKNALSKIQAATCIIGIESDRLLPTKEQILIAEHIPNCVYQEISSSYGHDGFLIETGKIARIFSQTSEIQSKKSV